MKQTLFLALVSAAVFSSCGRAGGNFTGREYMPDMAHSIAYESNTHVFYSNNRWGTEAEYRQMVEPRKPVSGTIPRGKQVFHYQDSEDERTRAMNEMTSNPIKPKTDAELKETLAKGKNLYNIYCSSCHGEKGDGNGKLYNNGNGPYPAKPANYLDEQFLTATDGRFYYAIMYGKNVMLSHADKLKYEERWQVIHYIRSLQAASKQQKYDLEAANRTKVNVAPTTDTTSVAPAPAPAPDNKDAKGKKKPN